MKYSVSGVMIVQDEERYVKRSIANITPYVKEVIVVDGGSRDNTVSICKNEGAFVVSNTFNGHFGDQRNFGIALSTQPWILMIDADEYMEDSFWELLPSLIEAEGIEAYKIPRKNYIDGVQDVNAFPDYQIRLFKRHCRWVFAVHEELVGYFGIKEITPCIIHDKSSKKHKIRNDYYESIKALRPYDVKRRET